MKLILEIKVEDLKELINYRIEKLEKDCGMTFEDEFKCGFLTGYVDLLEYLEEQTKGGYYGRSRVFRRKE